MVDGVDGNRINDHLPWQSHVPGAFSTVAPTTGWKKIQPVQYPLWVMILCIEMFDFEIGGTLTQLDLTISAFV
jgi:hypothetical protein